MVSVEPGDTVKVGAALMPTGVYPRPVKVADLPAVCHPERNAFVGVQCRRCYEKAQSAADPDRGERIRTYARERYRGLPLEKRRAGIVAKYGITVDELNARLEQQGGVCALCPKDITGRAANGYSRACVDHDHATGRVRGLLCTACNSSLGQLGDDVAGLQRAIEYLRNDTHPQ